MKLILNALCLMLIFSPVQTSAQETSSPSQNLHFGVIPIIEGKLTYTNVVKVDSIPKEELYRRCKKFITTHYKSAKDVIQLDDKENAEIICKGSFPVYWQATFNSGQETNVLHSFNIICKDGRFKYEVTDLVIKYYSSGGNITSAGWVEMDLKKWNTSREQNLIKYLTSLDQQIKTFIYSFEAAMKQPTSTIKDDW